MDRLMEDVCLISNEVFSAIDSKSNPAETEASCSSCTFVNFPLNLDQEMDSQLEKFAFDISKEPEKIKKKRGRKLLRPNDPIQKKTEIKDKYWLRAFRNFIKVNFSRLSSLFDSDSLKFWKTYISKLGKPGKGTSFLSYGKSYKAFLFSEKTFASLFKAWFLTFGELELMKKYEPNSDIWFIYYDYALKEIAKDGIEYSSFQNFFYKKMRLGESHKKTVSLL